MIPVLRDYREDRDWKRPWVESPRWYPCSCCAPAIVGTIWCGITDNKLYLTSGIFSSTLKTSQDPHASATTLQGVSWNGTDVPWHSGGADKWYLQSGLFSSTIKTSQATGFAGGVGVGWDGVDSMWGRAFAGGGRLMLQSGQFTSTIKTSQSVILQTSNIPPGVSWDGVDTPWSGTKILTSDDYLWLTSGQFTSTIKTSQQINIPADEPVVASGCCDHAPDTLWVAETHVGGNGRLLLQSGQFTSTIKTSQDVSGVDLAYDIAHTDNAFG